MGFLDVDLTNNGRTLDAAFCANDGSVTSQLTVSKSNKDYQISEKIEPEMQNIGVTASYRVVPMYPVVLQAAIATKRNLF
jgi:hypothetical protein